MFGCPVYELEAGACHELCVLDLCLVPSKPHITLSTPIVLRPCPCLDNSYRKEAFLVIRRRSRCYADPHYSRHQKRLPSELRFINRRAEAPGALGTVNKDSCHAMLSVPDLTLSTESLTLKFTSCWQGTQVDRFRQMGREGFLPSSWRQAEMWGSGVKSASPPGRDLQLK